jgi:hypothetical protein
LRSAPSANVVVMIDSAAGETIAPPRPWSARAAMSQASGQRSAGEEDEPGHEHAAAAE